MLLRDIRRVGPTAVAALLMAHCGGEDSQAAGASCENGVHDEAETNVDCGGPCPACVDEVEQYGITWRFDRGHRAGQFANGDYWEYIVAKDNGEDVSTSSARDPYGYIDGELPEIGHAVHIFPTPWKGAVLSTVLMPQMQPVWNNPLIVDYIDRHVELGRWTQPDPCAPHDGDIDNYGITFGPDGHGGCILDADPTDGTGRYPELHGTYADEPIDGGYTSDFIRAMWAAYRH